MLGVCVRTGERLGQGSSGHLAVVGTAESRDRGCACDSEVGETYETEEQGDHEEDQDGGEHEHGMVVFLFVGE